MARITNEATLKAILCQEVRAALRRFVVIRHEDRFTHGIPDMSVTGNKITSWWEAKYAYAEKETQTPDFQTKGIQELTLRRLALAGYAAFVVYWERGVECRTYVLEVKDLNNDDWANLPHAKGFDHNYVVEYIRKVHGDYDRA